MTPEEIIQQFDDLDLLLQEHIKQVLYSNLTNAEKIFYFQSQEFESWLDRNGFVGLLEEYLDSIDQKGLLTVQQFSKYIAENRIEIIADNMNLIKNSYERTIVGFFRANNELVRTEITNSLVQGQDAVQTFKNLQEKYLRTSDKTPHIISDANINTVVNTSYRDFDRSVTANIFEDKPAQRFRYSGGVIETSSEECRWLFLNQDPKGYTKAEIDKGIETPFTNQKTGEKKKIFWQGRVPNYNCIHYWTIVDIDGEKT